MPIDFKLEFYIIDNEVVGVRTSPGMYQVYQIELTNKINAPYGWITAPDLYKWRFYQHFKVLLPSRPAVVLSQLMGDCDEF